MVVLQCVTLPFEGGRADKDRDVAVRETERKDVELRPSDREKTQIERRTLTNRAATTTEQSFAAAMPTAQTRRRGEVTIIGVVDLEESDSERSPKRRRPADSDKKSNEPKRRRPTDSDEEKNDEKSATVG
ncbi:hypothetical protein HN873_013453 [Arachis hypogaea]